MGQAPALLMATLLPVIVPVPPTSLVIVLLYVAQHLYLTRPAPSPVSAHSLRSSAARANQQVVLRAVPCIRTLIDVRAERATLDVS